jgi:hypothetical protein
MQKWNTKKTCRVMSTMVGHCGHSRKKRENVVKTQRISLLSLPAAHEVRRSTNGDRPTALLDRQVQTQTSSPFLLD